MNVAVYVDGDQHEDLTLRIEMQSGDEIKLRARLADAHGARQSEARARRKVVMAPKAPDFPARSGRSWIRTRDLRLIRAAL